MCFIQKNNVFSTRLLPFSKQKKRKIKLKKKRLVSIKVIRWSQFETKTRKFPVKSNRSHMFFKIGVLLKLRKFHCGTPVLEYLFNKVASLKACNFIKKIIQLRCFPVKFAKFLRTSFLQNTSGGSLLLTVIFYWQLSVYQFFKTYQSILMSMHGVWWVTMFYICRSFFNTKVWKVTMTNVSESLCKVWSPALHNCGSSSE